ncbi:MAG: hypothetical protein HYR88_04005 [Verrucomicrobia bacterium]|nr:hypothetical protein [Verrucomicrobiota bacterium]MBI3869144.1 hypothetical protein [Verrucomicrobiota bacterium]
MRRRCHSRVRLRALSLLELMVYIAVLMVILSLSYAALYRTTDTTKHLGRNAQDISRALRAGERWREDIRSATAAIEFDPGAAQVSIKIPRKDGVVRYTFRDGACWREASGRSDPERLLDRVRNSQFLAETRSLLACWRWELELEPSLAKAHMKPLFTFIALAGVGAPTP